MKYLEKKIDKAFEKMLETSGLFRKYVEAINLMTKQLITIATDVVNLSQMQYMHQQALVDLYTKYSAIGKALQKDSIDFHLPTDKVKTTDKPN